jgi:sugar/nucleoside kinase (ribokinase family)
VPVINLKKGYLGSIVREGAKEHNIPIHPVKVENRIGAGDSYAAGFLFGYSLGLDVERCAHIASHVASSVCARKEQYF